MAPLFSEDFDELSNHRDRALVIGGENDRMEVPVQRAQRDRDMPPGV